jgi:hypothetical protein
VLFRVDIEVILLAVLTLQVIHVALVIIDALELFLEQLECEVAEQDALHERKNAGDKSIWVAGFVHVVLCSGS